MSLTSLFNFNYLKENARKSKATLLLCILLLPIINGIVLLMRCSSGDNFVPSIYDVSGFMLFGMYFIPIVIAISLFSFVYKRGSIDFTLSMPINKKQIFLSNTILGIGIIFVMHFINFVIMLIISLIYSNIIISYRMLFDILFMGFVSYVFVFVCSNIAIGVSSNKITTIVVTLLILFLVPFISSFINSNAFSNYGYYAARIECTSDSCKPLSYSCYDIGCEVNKKNNIYHSHITKYDSNIYTLPYGILNDILFGIESNNNISKSICKMVILSILYIVIGVILFNKKKFEICNTSFRSENVHIFVRSLTTIPILCIYFNILKNISISSYDFFSVILLIVLIFAYLIIYDLITRKRVGNFFKMAICLIIVGSMVIFTGYLVDDDRVSIKARDIKEISFLDDNGNVIGSSRNMDVINKCISLLLSSDYVSDYVYSYSVRCKVGSDIYSFNVYMNKDNYDYINGILSSDKLFNSGYSKYKNSRVFGIEYIDGYSSSYDSNLFDMIVNSYKNDNSTFNNSVSDRLFNVSLYVYDNFNVREVSYSFDGNKELETGILRYYNSNTKALFNDIDIDNEIYSYYINDSYVYNGYSEISKFIVNSLDDSFDINKDYGYISIYSNSGNNIFVSNRVDEINSLKNIVSYAELEDLVISDETDYD